MACAMSKNIRTILKPFLIMSYVFGLRIINLPINNSKLWFNFIYMLLIWLVYYFIATYSSIYFVHKSYPFEYHICYWLEIFISLLSVVFGVYHNKKFQNCLRKLGIVDDTLLELGTVTDYDKLQKKILWLILGWFVIVASINCVTTSFVAIEHDCDILTATIFVFVQNYFFHINVFGDLTTATILEYIGLKFDQINKHLQNLVINNDHKTKQAWKNLMIHSHQRQFPKILNSKRIISIIIHLHLELRKISCEIDSILVKEMSLKMACYFGWVVFDLRVIFYAILIDNYAKSGKIICVAVSLLWFSHNVSKFLLINYVCETVCTKATATADLINKLLRFTCDVEVREIISQFSLQMVHVPLRFYGIGLFQFGFKFLQRFIMSIATVLVIIIQTREYKPTYLSTYSSL